MRGDRTQCAAFTEAQDAVPGSLNARPSIVHRSPGQAANPSLTRSHDYEHVGIVPNPPPQHQRFLSTIFESDSLEHYPMEKLYHLGSLTEHITIQNVLGLVCTLAIFMYRDNLLWAVNSWRSPLRHLAGPKNDNLALGNQVYLMKKQNSTVWEEWVEKYGKTLRIRGFFGSYQLVTLDMRAINSVLSNPVVFPRSERYRETLKNVFGPGLLSVDVDVHKRQGPAFGQPQIQALVPVFCENANRLRDLWLEFMGNNPEGATIDVLQGLSRATLDSIGMTGFGYEFNSLQDGDEYELAKGFAGVFNSDKDTTTLTVIKAMVCQGLGIPTEETRHLKANMATTRRIGMKIVKDKKAMLLQGEKNGAASKERDLLSLLIKSNMTQETNGDQAMSDEEVLGHISTFLSGGQETTSTSTTWALYALALYPTVQNKLRKELLSAGLSEAPSMGELDKLPYLDNFVREVLRVYAVAPMVSRQAVQDAVIPVAESYKDRYGVVQTEIRVQKWDTVMIPILAMNRAKDVWGEDALEFKPERWNNLPPRVQEMPGVWGNVMTFIHGNQSCIGFRFAVTEIKALLHSLVRSIEFSVDPAIEIEGKSGLVTRPCVKSQPGNQMPLVCKPVIGA